MGRDFEAQENIHFSLTTLNALYHWESTGHVFGNAFWSEEDFTSPEDARADAINRLSDTTGLDFDLSAEEQAEMFSKIAQLHTSDVQSYQASVQCLPERYRNRCFYAQIMAAKAPAYLHQHLVL